MAVTKNTSIDFVTFINNKYIVKATYQLMESSSAILFQGDTLDEAQEKALKYFENCTKSNKKIHKS